MRWWLFLIVVLWVVPAQAQAPPASELMALCQRDTPEGAPLFLDDALRLERCYKILNYMAGWAQNESGEKVCPPVHFADDPRQPELFRAALQRFWVGSPPKGQESATALFMRFVRTSYPCTKPLPPSDKRM